MEKWERYREGREGNERERSPGRGKGQRGNKGERECQEMKGIHGSLSCELRSKQFPFLVSLCNVGQSLFTDCKPLDVLKHSEAVAYLVLNGAFRIMPDGMSQIKLGPAHKQQVSQHRIQEKNERSLRV